MKSLIGRMWRYFLQVCFPASRDPKTWQRGQARAFAPSPLWRDTDLEKQTAAMNMPAVRLKAECADLFRCQVTAFQRFCSPIIKPLADTLKLQR